jgi:hypothetical protein
MAEADNPLRVAMDARDPRLLEDSLAADVEVFSPIFSSPIVGRDAAIEVFSVVYEVFGPMTYRLDVPGDPHLFAWSSEVDGEPVEGIDLFRRDADAKVREVTVYMRPMSGVAAFLQAAGTAVARRREGGRALALRAASFPVAPLMKLTGKVGSRLIGTPPPR